LFIINKEQKSKAETAVSFFAVLLKNHTRAAKATAKGLNVTVCVP
jgi:hypothetical protein